MDKYQKYLSKKNGINNDKRSKYLKGLLSRILLSIIFILVSLIYVNYSDNNLLDYKKVMLTDTLPFNKVSNLTSKIFGEKDVLKKVIEENVSPVFNESLLYNKSNVHFDGGVFEVSDHYLVPILESGVVVFVGEKENYGNTIIIQGTNGIDIWYGNITNSNIEIYEYVEKGRLLGETNDTNLYLAFYKDGEFLNYEDYI